LKQFAKLAAITAFKEAAQTLQIDIQKFPAHKPRSLGDRTNKAREAYHYDKTLVVVILRR